MLEGITLLKFSRLITGYFLFKTARGTAFSIEDGLRSMHYLEEGIPVMQLYRMRKKRKYDRLGWPFQ
jgi:hypothetical protein